MQNRLREAGAASSNLVAPTTFLKLDQTLPTPSPEGVGQCSLVHLIRIPLTKGYFALVDAEDARRVREHNWCSLVSKHTVYGLRRAKGDDGKRHPILLHRFIAGAPKGMDVDHIDGNGLNNSKANLRVVERSQNTLNRVHGKPVKGAYLNKRTGRWRSEISVNGSRVNLGTYSTQVDAANAHSVALAKALS